MGTVACGACGENTRLVGAVVTEEDGARYPVDGEGDVTARAECIVSAVSTEVRSRFRATVEVAKHPSSWGVEYLVHAGKERLGEVWAWAGDVGEIDDSDHEKGVLKNVFERKYTGIIVLAKF